MESVRSEAKAGDRCKDEVWGKRRQSLVPASAPELVYFRPVRWFSKSVFQRIIVPVRSVLFPFAAILCLARGAFPQPAFEVVAIKPVDTTKGIMDAGVRVFPGGRIVIHALNLKTLIVAAYDAGHWQLSGGEEWMEKDLYDVEAKPAALSGIYSLRHTGMGSAMNACVRCCRRC